MQVPATAFVRSATRWSPLWLLLAVSWLLACGSTAPIPPPDIATADVAVVAPDALDLALHVQARPPGPGAGWLVTWTLPISPPNGDARPAVATWQLRLPGRWGHLSDLEAEVVDVRAWQLEASGVAGPAQAVERLGGVVSVAGTAPGVQVQWRVAPRRRASTAESQYRPWMSHAAAFGPGHALIGRPLDVDETAVRISLSVDPGGDGWAVQTTTPPAPRHALVALYDAAFWAGTWRTAQIRSNGRPIRVDVAGGAGLDPEEVARATAAVLEAQAAWLGPVAEEGARVVVLHREDQPDARSGWGRHGGFVLEAGAESRLDDEWLHIVAHENLHRLIGHRLAFAAADDHATRWFREGVTDVLAARSLAASGISHPAVFYRRIATALGWYRTNPLANTPIDALPPAEWVATRDARRLAYDKGALLGVWIDLALREAGAGDLGDFVHWLAYEDPRTDQAGGVLSNASLQASLSDYAGSDWAAFFTLHVWGAADLPISTRLHEAGLQVVERLEPAPWYGLRVGRRADGVARVQAVEANSPAARAGLRVGMLLSYDPSESLESPGPVSFEVTGDDLAPSARGRRVVLHPDAGQRRATVLHEDPRRAGLYLRAFGFPEPPPPR